MGILKTAGIVAVVVVLLVVGALFFLSQPGAPAQEYTEQVPQDYRSQNANLGGALYAGGIVDPFIDIDSEHAYVAYELPQGYDADMAQRFVIGAAADAAPTVAQIIVTQYSSGKSKVQWTVQLSDFRAFMNAQLTTEQMEAKIQKTVY
ncbi:MAG: hypothetical protein WC759_03070 [Candidatus Micrarchaeia archaeon]|jgi:hypothetical protein